MLESACTGQKLLPCRITSIPTPSMVDRIFPVAAFAAGANAAVINERGTPTGALGTDALTDPPEIDQLRPEVRFVLVGGGPEEARLRGLCRSSGLNGCMSFPGWVPHDRSRAIWSERGPSDARIRSSIGTGVGAESRASR